MSIRFSMAMTFKGNATIQKPKELREVEIERALRSLRQGTAGYCEYRLACPIVLDTRKNGRREASTTRD